MMTLDFKQEIGLWPFCTCTVKNMQYNHRYLQPNRQNFRILQEIVVEEHDGDVTLYTGLGCGADSTFHRTYSSVRNETKRISVF